MGNLGGVGDKTDSANNRNSRAMSVLLRVAALLVAITLTVVVGFGCRQELEDSQAIHPLPLPEESDAPVPTPTPIATNTPSPTPSPTPHTPEPLLASDFMPLESVFIAYDKDGATCDSYVEYFDEAAKCLQRRVIGAEKAPYVEVFSITDDAITLIYRRQNVGYTYNFIPTALKKGEGEVLLKSPIAVGTTWDVENGVSTITAVDIPLLLPMSGTLNAVEVTTEYADGASRTQYFSQGIGLTAQYFYDSSDQLTSAWKAAERERDRTFKQTIRFYFADQSDWSVKYMSRSLNIKSNTDIARRFSDELRKIPAGSYLVPLPARARIRSVSVDYKKGIKLDLSREFVTQLQVGRTGEKLMLQALADTFGEYFQCSAVYFTVEGQLYESPYMMFINGDEYINADTASAQRYKS